MRFRDIEVRLFGRCLFARDLAEPKQVCLRKLPWPRPDRACRCPECAPLRTVRFTNSDGAVFEFAGRYLGSISANFLYAHAGGGYVLVNESGARRVPDEAIVGELAGMPSRVRKQFLDQLYAWEPKLREQNTVRL